MGQVIGKDGKVYTIFEYLEPIAESAESRAALIADEKKRKEKKLREREWKLRARYNYRKK